MYDGYFDKWSHSWLPTPTNPLSPLIAWADPYYLERKHSEDMPYPISGPMFEEGTPWGTVLNPTIGLLLKPQKELHDDDYFIFGRVQNGIDIVSLLHNANMSIMERARSFAKTHYISVNKGEASAVSWNAFDAPTPEISVASFQSKGAIGTMRTGTYGIYGTGTAGYGIGAAGGPGIMQAPGMFGAAVGDSAQQNAMAGFNAFSDDYSINMHLLAKHDRPNFPELVNQALFAEGRVIRNGDIIQNESGELGIYQNTSIHKPKGSYLTTKQEIELDLVTKQREQFERQSVLTIMNKYDPRNMVKDLNKRVIEGSRERVDSPWEIDEDLGFTSAKKLTQFRPSQAMELLQDADTVSDLINQGQGADLVKSASTTVRLIGGIYGYMGAETIGLGIHNEKTLATSSDMTSYTRAFWDLNLGGAGGAVSEIGRRFIPNFQRMNKVNPMMNDMPSWLPERFRYGNAYCISDDTLVETDNLQFTEAIDIKEQDTLLSHTGTKREVEAIRRRPIGDQEKVYQLKVASITAVESKFSEDHPILVFNGKTKTLVDWHHNNRQSEQLSKYQKYNAIISCLLEGVTNKKEIAQLTGISIDWLYLYFRDLVKLNIIEDYKKDRYQIHPIIENLKLFDLDMIYNRVAWRKAKDVSVGDYVAYPLPKYSEQNIIIDMAIITDYPASDQYVYTSGQCFRPDFISAYEYLEQHGVPVFSWGERKIFLKTQGWSEKSYEAAQSMIRMNKVPERMSRFIQITPELSYAMGLWLAEGWTMPCGIGYALHRKEYSLFERALNGIINAGFHVTKSTWKLCHNSMGAQGYIYCKPLATFMQFMMNEYAHYKTLNEMFWNMNSNCLLRFLEGYIDGDGYNYETITGVYNRRSYRVGVASCNLKLLLQIRKLCLRFGIILNIKKINPPQVKSKIGSQEINTGINYSATVDGQMAVDFVKLLWNVDIFYEQQRQSPKHVFIKDQYLFMRVQDITECPNIKFVNGYQMAVEKSFCTAGVATHNTSLPRGEMRLPGEGWLSVPGNKLHPDQFSTPGDPYGALDRMKILADIAPSSPEYKLWRDIVAKTVVNPDWKNEAEEIKKRAREQGKKHDFYKYNVVGQDLQYENVVVSEILNYGKFRSGNRIFKIAGVSLKANQNESMKDVLGNYIQVGQEVTIATDVNEAYGKNNDAQHSINAAVYVEGESIGKQMLESGDAVERKGDQSAAAKIGDLSALQWTIGYTAEVLSHLDIPILSDQWLRVRSPYESYLAENVYGTPYQSWSHPIQTFIAPAVERAIHERSIVSQLASTAIWNILENERTPSFNISPFNTQHTIPSLKLGRDAKHALLIGQLLTNRAALVGFATANVLDAGNIKAGIAGSRISEMLVSGMHIMSGGNSYLDMAGWGAYLGFEYGRYQEITNIGKRGKLMAIGAAASMAYRGVTGKTGEEYVSDRVKKNWEMQEYWDRLTYLKYEGLYKEAARRAKEEEGVDVEEALKTVREREEERQGSLGKLKYFKKILGEAYDGKTNYMKNHLIQLVNSRIKELEVQENIVEGGKYTQTALIYKRAAESTMQGLQDNAGWSQIISALPQNDREYFMEFVAEKDKNRREQILSIVSPSLQRALRMSWGMKQDEPISNSEYFKDHYLPDADWEGWKPDTDLRDIEVKTIENEAMNLSDFGFYESQLRNPGAVNAEPLHYDQENTDISLSREIGRVLRGKGLKNVEVDVIEKNTMGPTEIIANIGTWAGINHDKDIEAALAS